MKVLSPNNEGFMFHAGSSAMIDTSNDTYGAIIYGYNETEVLLWRPSPTNTNGHLVYVGGKWGYGQSYQESDVVEVLVKVIDITGTPCSNTELCSPDWSQTRCVSTDCPIPLDIANAYRLYDGVTNGSKALYACKTGFTESSDDVIIKCIEGTWSKSAMFCKVVCPSPPAVENAAALVQDNRAKYFCLTGYFTMKNTVDVIECRNSIWPSTDFKCIKSCPDPPTIANADVMVSNNVALYSCRQGFLPKSGTSSINCSLSEWQKTNFTCY
ncbi:sushi, von Willebrand factor type A, EGF and pentraxin domain-containing protein 1-like, partial [Saccostrea cucullata]|uniref:sushi, von Willebrand factor type A, EGF and pentraxin domain-containing protein 1-like n=1 Tax=Saccostrea cuccullata TaxID=36930 RepID=UPI002ED5C07D